MNANGPQRDLTDRPHGISPWRRWYPIVFKLAVVAVLIWGVERTLGNGLRELRQRAADETLDIHMAWLVASGGFYLAGLLPAGLYWRYLLLRLGQRVRLADAVRAYYIGHLGKYVPGKAMVVLLRAGLVRSRHVDPLVAAAAVFYETLTMMAVGAAMSAAILAVRSRDHLSYMLAALVIMVLVALPTLPPVFRRLMRGVSRFRRMPTEPSAFPELGLRTLCWGWLWIGSGWWMIGLSFWAAARAVGANASLSAADLSLYTAAASLATVAGFLSLLPGGIIVRDGLLMELMAPRLGPGVALLAAVVLRITWLVAELLISTILYVYGRFAFREE